MRYISIIRSFYPSLSKGEKKIADYVMEQKDQIIYQTLHEISKNVGVGEATVVRFCHKIGFEGYQNFKLSVAKEVPMSVPSKDTDYTEAVAGNLQNTIIETKQILSVEDIDKAVDMIRKSNRVFLYGVGTSGNATMDMQSRLLRYGKIVTAITDSHHQVMTSAVLGEDDLIIAFSLSGYTRDIVESLELAKQNKVKVVAITNHKLSPVAELADVVILSAGKESPMDGGSLSGRVSQMFITDIICTGYAVKNKKVTYKMREKTANSVVKKSLEYNKKSGGRNG